jgi:small subunit ribosomal protein S1
MVFLGDMAKKNLGDEYKAKFRPDESALDKEIDAALAGLPLDALYEQDNATPGTAARGARRGKIISISKDDVFVDFGGKSQGIASVLQFEAEPKVGEEYEFNVERYDQAEGLLILTRKGATATDVSWEKLDVGQVVEGTVTGTNKGGLELDVKGMRAFMPAGQVDVYHVPDLAQFVGQKFTAEVTQFEAAGRNLVLSRRNILEREREEQKKKLM